MVKCADCGKELGITPSAVSLTDLRPLCDYCYERDIPYPFLDPKVREIVREINKLACITQGSCQGHPEDPISAACIVSLKPTDRPMLHKQVREILADFKMKSNARLAFTERKFVDEDGHQDWLCCLKLDAGGKTVSEKRELLNQARRAFLQVLRGANLPKASEKTGIKGKPNYKITNQFPYASRRVWPK